MPGMLDLVEVRDPADGRLDFGNGDFTVSIWVKTTQSPVGAPDIVVKWPSSNSSMGPRAGWALTLPQGGLLFKGFSETTAQIGVSGPAINDGNWHHIVGQRDGNELVLWVDGQQVVPGSTPWAACRTRRRCGWADSEAAGAELRRAGGRRAALQPGAEHGGDPGAGHRRRPLTQ